MFCLKKPTAEKIRAYLTAQRDVPYTYPCVGASRSSPPIDYQIDHNRIRLGAGRETFQRAKAALQRWQMFQIDWLELCFQDTPIAPGECVGVMVRIFGVWTLNPCRIVYVLDESGPIEKFGFAYGTLNSHVEAGEERFSVEWHHEDDSVWYDILAFSRANHCLVKLGHPYARFLQKRFAVDSLRAMLRAVSK